MLTVTGTEDDDGAAVIAASLERRLSDVGLTMVGITWVGDAVVVGEKEEVLARGWS